MHPRIPAAPVALGALAAAMIASVPLVSVASAAATTPKPIPNTRPAWTTHARHLGAAASTAPITARVYFAPKGGLDALKAVVTDISTPGSAQYQHFLTEAQYLHRFGIAASTVSRATTYLRSAGLQVSRPAPDNSYVTVTGSVQAADRAFATRIERYRHAGRTVQAPSRALQVPSALAASVLTISGLDTTPQRTAPARVAPDSTPLSPPPAGLRNGRPCSIDYGTLRAKYAADYRTPLPTFGGNVLPYAVCGYTGPQLRSAYEDDTDLDGTGVTVAITDAYAAPTIAADAGRYASRHGDGSYVPGQLTQVLPKKFTDADPDDCDASGWYGEETLDVEAVHAMAPGANIRYYASTSCNDGDFFDTLARVVKDDAASIVSNSWSDVEQNSTTDSIAAYEKVFLQGAAQGMSFVFASGDDGDELDTTGIAQVDYPSSDPYVTAVGGTSTAIANGELVGQSGWGTHDYMLSADSKRWVNEGYLYGSGGGASVLFNRPAYQRGTTSSPYRTLPDVAMEADPNTGMLVGETQTFTDGVRYDEYRVGGTSLAAPLFAGETALRLQSTKQDGGLLNPTIYASKAAFSDVTNTMPDRGVVRVNFLNSENAHDGLQYLVRTFGQDGSLRTTRGYDLVTGVGVPKPAWFSPTGT